MLGFKRNYISRVKDQEMTIKNVENIETNLSIKSGLRYETLLKLKLHNKDITVSIYDKNMNLIKEFDRIKKAADYVGLDRSSVSTYIKNGNLWQNSYYFKLKVNSPINYDNETYSLNKLTEVNNNIKKTNRSYILEV
jgi:hypothetical protein